MRQVIGRALAVTLIAATLAACGISEDSSPRDIPENFQRDLGITSDRSAGAAAGSARIYLIAPAVTGQAPSLQPAARDVNEQPASVLQTLFAGANAAERATQLRTALPTGLKLLSARLQGGTLHVDVSKDIVDVSGNDLIDAIGQIVFTSSELAGVRSVKISVEGADQLWPAGDGSLQSTPLTVYDYPGLVTSAQPAYPAIPSGTLPS
ncbi:MAG: GerMN domain-containing protein [Actinomycetota bacterium]